MKYILFYITLYYTVMILLSLFTTRKYLTLNNLPFIIILFLYIIAGIIFISGIFNDLNVISINPETTSYLDEMDFTVELPEIHQNNQIEHSTSNDNFILGFLNLFKNDSVYLSINNELKNTYYINKQGIWNNFDKVEWIDICTRYEYCSAHNKEVLSFIDSFMEILNDLESIENNLSKVKV